MNEDRNIKTACAVESKPETMLNIVSETMGELNEIKHGLRAMSYSLFGTCPDELQDFPTEANDGIRSKLAEMRAMSAALRRSVYEISSKVE